MNDPFTPLMLAAHPGPRKALRRALRQRQQAPLHRLTQTLDARCKRVLQLEGIHGESHSLRLIRLAEEEAGDTLITNLHLERRYGGIWISEPGPLSVYRYPPGALGLDRLLSSPASSGLSALAEVKDPNIQLLTLIDAGRQRALALVGHRLPWFSAEPRVPTEAPDRARYRMALALVECWARQVVEPRRPDRVVPPGQWTALTRFDPFD